MSPNATTRLVVDVGNTRIKWGLCDSTGVAKSASLPPDDPVAWQKQIDDWQLSGPLVLAVSGVHPQRRDFLADWLKRRGDMITLLTSVKQLPLKVGVPEPEKVGIDRLLNAVAANSRRVANRPAVIVDAGSAITVDYVDRHGIFQGGAILPGLSLLAKALHDYTALLPLVEADGNFAMPGTSTTEAIKTGILCSAVGGIRLAIEKLIEMEQLEGEYHLFLCGGDAHLLSLHLPFSPCILPLMTLEGLRLAAWPTEKP